MIEPVCFYCGKPAQFLSVVNKRWRCAERIQSCKGYQNQLKAARAASWRAKGPSALSDHMRGLNAKAQQAIATKDESYHKARGHIIAEKLKDRGGHHGENNPMYGRRHTTHAKDLISQSHAGANPNKGQYDRTPEHRDRLSENMIARMQSGKMKQMRDTSIELQFATALDNLGVAYEKQFLIQFGSIKEGKRFRHCYDFRITDTNILVEIDGDYWHSRPEAIERDKICNQVAEDHGFYVIRILGSNLDQAIKDFLSVRI